MTTRRARHTLVLGGMSEQLTSSIHTLVEILKSSPEWLTAQSHHTSLS